MTTEKDDFENLVKSPGWLRLRAHAKQQWTDDLATQMRAAVGTADDVLALQKMRQVIVAKDAIERLLQWPDDQLKKWAVAAEPFVARVTRTGY